MKPSPLLRWGIGALAAVAILGVLRAKPWQRDAGALTPEEDARPRLAVGFLPVT